MMDLGVKGTVGKFIRHKNMHFRNGKIFTNTLDAIMIAL